MANLREWLEQAVKENCEPLEAIVVGPHYNSDWKAEPQADENIVLTVDQGLRKIDAEFDDGYGGADCFPIYAWSKSWVYFISEYDGATRLSQAPRNPMPIKPEFM